MHVDEPPDRRTADGGMPTMLIQRTETRAILGKRPGERARRNPLDKVTFAHRQDFGRSPKDTVPKAEAALKEK